MLRPSNCVLFAFLPALCLCGGTLAQEAAEGEGAAEKYAQLKQQWEKVDGQLDALARQFRDATPAERPAIREQYMARLDESQKLLPQLRAAAIDAFRQAPNEDEDLVRLLIGIANSDLRADRFGPANEVVDLLLEGGTDNPALPSLAGAVAYCVDDFDEAAKHLQAASDARALTDMGRHYLSDVPTAQRLWKEEAKTRQAEAKAEDLPRVKLVTNKGTMTVELYENEAPQTVGNFVNLVEQGFYDGLTFHRVLPGFMAQGGCPDGTGAGGPGYHIYCECQKENRRNHFRGTLSMAHAGKDTGGSQFFITFARTPHLDGRHTVFGRVVEGVETLAALQRRDPSSPRPQPGPDQIIKAQVVRKRDHAYVPTKVAP